jgi:hypothetical protein
MLEGNVLEALAKVASGDDIEALREVSFLLILYIYIYIYIYNIRQYIFIFTYIYCI